MIALHDLSAHELSTAYRTRRLSPVEVTRAVLSRIDAWEKRINAMYVIDAAGALAMAAASQERWPGVSRSARSTVCLSRSRTTSP